MSARAAPHAAMAGPLGPTGSRPDLGGRGPGVAGGWAAVSEGGGCVPQGRPLLKPHSGVPPMPLPKAWRHCGVDVRRTRAPPRESVAGVFRDDEVFILTGRVGRPNSMSCCPERFSHALCVLLSSV